MAKEQKIEFKGTVLEKTHDLYKIEIDLENKAGSSKLIVTARVSGKIRMNNIRILAGDKVTVEMSPTDLTHGIIKYRN